MAYIASENIKVFPSVGRDTTIDADSELTNEKNLSNILRNLYKRESFVISENTNDEFEFVIYGYYFRVKSGQLPIEENKKLYAHIEVLEGFDSSNTYQQLKLFNQTTDNNSLQVLDNNNEFQGISFDDSETHTAPEHSGRVAYTLQLLDERGQVPRKSLLHYKSNEILDEDTDNYINEVFTTEKANITTAAITNSSITDTLTTATLTVTGNSTLSGKLDVTGDITTSSNATIAKNLKVTGTTSLTGTLNVGGDNKTTISNNTIQTSTITANTITINKISSDSDEKGSITLNNSQLVFTPFGITDQPPTIFSELIPPVGDGEAVTNLIFRIADDPNDSFIFRWNDTNSVTISKDMIIANTFSGALAGNANTASNFNSKRTLSLTGPITGTSTASSGNHSIATSITDGAVTTSKIAGKSVTTDKINDSAVTTDKIADENVTNVKIADSTIKKEKLGFDITMTLSVNTADPEHGILVITTPSLTDK